MRKLFIAAVLAVVAANIQAQTIEKASDAVKNMGLGWNLGNTLDAHSQKTTDWTSDDYWNCQGLDSETCWGQQTTQKELFAMLKKAGIGAVRVPVTWYNHMDKDGNVNAEWMARVKQVVDWVLAEGMYCIINVHHDTGADGEYYASWIKADEDNYTTNKTRYENLWKNIATEFKDYDQHLLFEGYNEMLDKVSSWCFASFNTSSKYDATIAKSAYNAINSYAQSFVTTVRATGGNNATRNLIMPTYAACCGIGTWNSHLTDPLSELKIPADDTEGHIIVDVHAYPNIENLTTAKTEFVDMLSKLKKHIQERGAEVILGEWGTSNVDAGAGHTDYDVRRDQMFQFVDFVIARTKNQNIATFYWMGLTDGIYRTQKVFNQADLAERLAKAYHGQDYKGEYPTPAETSEIVVFEGEKEITWGNGITIAGDLISKIGRNVRVDLEYTQKHDNQDFLQFYDGWWNVEDVHVAVDGKTYTHDFQPSVHYGTKEGSEHVTSFTLPEDAEYELIAARGLVVHGDKITLKKATILDPSVSGIESISHESASQQSAADSQQFNIAGQRVGTGYKGIVIKNGKKFLNVR